LGRYFAQAGMVANEVKFIESEKILAKIIKIFVKCAHLFVAKEYFICIQ